MSAVAVRGVAKSYGATPVLRSIDLDLADGEVVVLLGPSGCGKTTLLRLIAGLDHVDAGTIAVDDEVCSSTQRHVEPEHRHVGMVFQNGALFPHLDAARNVGFGLPRPERRSSPRIDELLALVGMSELAARRPDELSGGQQQRVALARALAPRPRVVLMDEPFSNLDAVLRLRLRHEVRAVLDAEAVTTLFVTHDRDEAFALGDRVAVMRDGEIRQVGPPAVVYDQPVDAWVAGFVGDADLVRGRLVDGRVATVLGVHDLAAASAGVAAGDVDVLVRPEQLVVSRRTSDAASDARAGATGHVRHLEFVGSTTLITVGLDDGTSLRSRTLGVAPVGVGDAVDVRRGADPVVAFVPGAPGGT